MPVAVPLFSAPRWDAGPAGEVRVTSPWVIAKEGGCSGLEVKALAGPAEPGLLPTLELEYESPAGIVLEKSGLWCRLKLRTGSGWIRDGCETGFVAVLDVLRDKPLYLRPGALARARASAGGLRFESPRVLQDAATIQATLVDSATIDGRVWLHLAASHIGACEDEPSPEEVHRFWLPLFDADQALQVWFHSRGC